MTTTTTTLSRQDIDRLATLCTDAAVADFTDTVGERLDAGVVDKDVYISNWLEMLHHDEEKVGLAENLGELTDDQARFARARIAAKREALEILERKHQPPAPTMTELLERTAGSKPSEVAHEYLEENICDYLPGYEAGNEETDALWIHARIAVEGELIENREPTEREVADRVAVTWLTLYGMPPAQDD